MPTCLINNEGQIMRDYKNCKVNDFNAPRLALIIVIGLIVLNSLMYIGA